MDVLLTTLHMARKLTTPVTLDTLLMETDIEPVNVVELGAGWSLSVSLTNKSQFIYINTRTVNKIMLT